MTRLVIDISIGRPVIFCLTSMSRPPCVLAPFSPSLFSLCLKHIFNSHTFTHENMGKKHTQKQTHRHTLACAHTHTSSLIHMQIQTKLSWASLASVYQPREQLPPFSCFFAGHEEQTLKEVISWSFQDRQKRGTSKGSNQRSKRRQPTGGTDLTPTSGWSG